MHQLNYYLEAITQLDQTLNPSPASSEKAGSCLPLDGSIQYRTLTNHIYWSTLLTNCHNITNKGIKHVMKH